MAENQAFAPVKKQTWLLQDSKKNPGHEQGLEVVQLFWKPSTNSTRELPDFLTHEV